MATLEPIRTYVTPEGETRAVYQSTKDYALHALLKHAGWKLTDYSRNAKGDRLELWQDKAWETWEDQFNPTRLGQVRQIGRVDETIPGLVSSTYQMVGGTMVKGSEEVLPDRVHSVANYEMDVPADMMEQSTADFEALARMPSSEAPVLRGISPRGLVSGDYVIDNRTPAKSHVYRIRREGPKVFRERFIDSQTSRGQRMIEGGEKHAAFPDFTPAKVAEDPSGILTRMCTALNLPLEHNARIYQADTYGETYSFRGRVGQEKQEKAVVDPWETPLTPYELEEVTKVAPLPEGDVWFGTLSKRFGLSTGAISLALNQLAKADGLDASFRKTYGSNLQADGKDSDKLISGSDSFSTYMDYVPDYDPYTDYYPGRGAKLHAKYVARFIPAAILAEHQLNARGGFRSKPTPLAHKLYLDLTANKPAKQETVAAPSARKSGEREAVWTSPTYGQVEVISGAAGKRDVWHNIKISHPKTRYGYSSGAKRWAQGNIPSAELLAEVAANGWASLFDLPEPTAPAPVAKMPSIVPQAATSRIPTPIPSKPPMSSKPPRGVEFVTVHEPRVEAPAPEQAPPSRFRKADRKVGAFEDLSLLDKIYSMAAQGSDWHLPEDPYGLTLVDTPEDVVFASLCGYLGASQDVVLATLKQLMATKTDFVSALARRERSAIKLVLPDNLTEWANHTALPTGKYNIPQSFATAMQRVCSPFVRYANYAYYERAEYPYNNPAFLPLALPEYLADVTLTTEAVRWGYEYEKNSPGGHRNNPEEVTQADSLLMLLCQDNDVTGWWGSPGHRQIVQISPVAWVRWVFNRFFGEVSTRASVADPYYLLYFPWDRYPTLLAPIDWLRGDTATRMAHLKAAGFHGGQYFRWLTELDYTGPVSEGRVIDEFKRLSEFGRYGDNPWAIESTPTTITLTCDLYTSKFSHTLKVGGGKRAQLLALATSFEVRDAWMRARYTPKADDFFVKGVERKLQALSEVFGPMDDMQVAPPTVTFAQQGGQLQVILTNHGKVQKLFWVDELIPGKRHGYYLGDGGKVRMIELSRFTEEAVRASPAILVAALKKMGLTVPAGTVLQSEGMTILLPLDLKSTVPSAPPPAPPVPPRFVKFTPPPAPPMRPLGPYELLPQRGEHGEVTSLGIEYGVVFQGGRVAVLPTGDKLDIPNLPAEGEHPYVLDGVKVSRYRPGDAVRVVSDYVVDKKDYRLVAPQDGEYGEVQAVRVLGGQIRYDVWLRSLETGRRTILRTLPAGELAFWEGAKLSPPPGIVSNIRAFQSFCGLNEPGTIDWVSTALAFAVELWGRGERDHLDRLDVREMPELMYYPNEGALPRTFPLPATFPRVVVARETDGEGRPYLSVFDWTQQSAISEGVFWAMQQLAPRMGIPYDHPAWLIACGMVPVEVEEWAGLSEARRRAFVVDGRAKKTHGWLG